MKAASVGKVAKEMCVCVCVNGNKIRIVDE
jgi:hypothetical protein